MNRIYNLKSTHLLLLILIFGAILRLYHLNFQSVWLDEIHTLNDANPSNSMSEVYSSIVAADPHPPLYFYIIHFLFKIFGYTPLVARLFSAIIGITAIYAIYKLGKELIGKEVGLISALLITINGYHIYYSQEARPYSLLCLFTIFSFLYLIRFIKTPTRKNAILYGVFTVLMLYGHFFSLFALLSQFFILFIFLVLSEKEKRKPFFINCVISVLVMTILFLPSLKIFQAANAIKDFWIPLPTADVYTLIFKEFFGNSEMILCLVGLLLFLYIIKLSKEKATEINYNAIIENKVVFSFIILIPWIVIVILIPLIRSYLSIPMIISRYFINVLPAILILIAIGISQFKNQIIKISFILLFFIFTITDSMVVKKYYTNINKTQFREVTQFIIDNNKKNEPVVTSLPWYFPYFLNNEKYHYNIVGKNLDEYVQEISKDTINRKPFWYVDAHNRPYKVTEQTQKYLDENFVVENSIDLFDTWTKHYVFKSDTPTTINISKYLPLKDKNGDEINYYIENYTQNDQEIKLSGWAYFTNQSTNGSVIEVVFIKDGAANSLFTQKVKRDDVTTYFKSSNDLSNSGFSSVISFKNLQKGKYSIGIYIKDNITKKEGLILTDKSFEK